MSKQILSTEDRFWDHVNKRGEDECWEWIAGCSDTGYGHFYDSSVKKTVGTHRYSYVLHKGPIPKRLLVRHTCHNRKCVNPKHLRVGTHKDNSEDAVKAGRMRHGENHYASKLSENDVREIKRMFAAGARTGDIAKHFSVTKAAISDIRSGRNWSHVTLDDDQSA